MQIHNDTAVATVKGTFWRYISHLSGKTVVVVTTIILARLLSKEDFGIAGYAIVAIGFLDVLSDLGIGVAIIYFPDDHKRWNTAFWLNLVVGAGLYLITYSVAPFIATFFHDSRAIDVIRVLGLTFPISAVSNIHDALLQKQIAFGRKLIPDFFRSLTKGVISIALAVLGFGPWSLIYGQLVGTAISVISYWWIHKFRPTFEIEKSYIRPLLSYGMGIVMVNALGVAILNVDYLFVGRYLGPIALGVYTLSFRVPELLVKEFCTALGQVLFPVYSKMKENKAVLTEGILATMRYVTMVTFPLSIGLALVARPFVYTVFSAKWADAIPVIPAISIYTLIRSLTFNIGDVYKVQGRLRMLNKISIAQLSLLLPALYLGVTYFKSITAVGWMQVGVVLIGGTARFILAAHLLKTPIRAFGKAVEPAFLASLFMSAAVLGTLHFISNAIPAVQLVVGSLVGAAVYLGALWIFKRDVVMVGVNTVRVAIRRREKFAS